MTGRPAPASPFPPPPSSPPPATEPSSDSVSASAAPLPPLSPPGATFLATPSGPVPGLVSDGPPHLPPPPLLRGHGLCQAPGASYRGNKAPALLQGKVIHDGGSAATRSPSPLPPRLSRAAGKGLGLPGWASGGRQVHWEGSVSAASQQDEGTQTQSPDPSLTPAPRSGQGKNPGSGLCRGEGGARFSLSGHGGDLGRDGL